MKKFLIYGALALLYSLLKCILIILLTIFIVGNQLINPASIDDAIASESSGASATINQ